MTNDPEHQWQKQIVEKLSINPRWLEWEGGAPTCSTRCQFYRPEDGVFYERCTLVDSPVASGGPCYPAVAEMALALTAQEKAPYATSEERLEAILKSWGPAVGGGFKTPPAHIAREQVLELVAQIKRITAKESPLAGAGTTTEIHLEKPTE